jgi:dienelactone hydrolase
MLGLRDFFVGVALCCVSLAPHALAQNASSSLPARIDVIPFETLTLSDKDFLTGDKSAAKPVTIAGQLYNAQGPGKHPVVVMLHGSAGINGSSELWAREFAEMGVSTMLVDSYSGRGIVSTLDDQSQLGRLNMVVDAYRALAKLKDHPGVDASRIALMGFSRGGQAALLASIDRFHGLWNASGADFVAYVPFYGDCRTVFIDDTKLKPAPVRMHHGESDDYVPAAACIAYAERLKAAGRDVQITVYKDAHHVFDFPLISTKPFILAQAQTTRNCLTEERTRGEVVNIKTGQAFTYADPCVERGPHVGYNAEAATAARASVRKTMKSVFHL